MPDTELEKKLARQIGKYLVCSPGTLKNAVKRQGHMLKLGQAFKRIGEILVENKEVSSEDLDLLMGLPATIGELEGEELEIPTEREVGIPPRDKILDLARTDPLATASMIRAWLREKR